MVKFVFPSEREGWVYGIRGTVISAKKWSETHVTSSGGGGYVNPRSGGHVGAPTVRSRTITRGEIWVKNKDGIDRQFSMNIPAVEGQKIVIIWGNIKKKNVGDYIYWHNISSQKHKLIEPVNLKFLEKLRDRIRRFFLFWGVWISLALAVGYYGSWKTGWVLCGGVGGLISAGIFESVLIALKAKNSKNITSLKSALYKISMNEEVELNG